MTAFSAKVNERGQWFDTSRYEVLEPSTAKVLERLLHLAGIQAGPSTPKGAFARSVDGHTLYVNTTEEKKTVILEGIKRRMLTDRIYEGALDLGPLDSDLVR